MGGPGVAAAATAPISAVASGKIDQWTLTDFIVVLLIVSLLLPVIGQLILQGVKS